MKQQDFHSSFTTDATTEEAFNAITNVTQWWTENLKGQSEKLNDEFSVQFGDVHYSKQQLIEVVPGKKVVWLVTDSQLNFITDKQEWTNTKINFEISAAGKKTRVDFTHIGLAPNVECFDACSNAWSQYIQGSLKKLMDTGKGEPTAKS